MEGKGCSMCLQEKYTVKGVPAEEAFQENYSGYINILEPRSLLPPLVKEQQRHCVVLRSARL